MNIKLTADKRHKRQYKKLLSSEWSLKTLKDSFLLIDDFLNSGGLSLRYSDRTDKFDWKVSMVPYMNLLLLQINDSNLPIIPSKIPQRKSKSKLNQYNLVAETVYDLVFPLSAKFGEFENLKPEGDLDFLKDLKSLIFLLASNYIIPELTKENMKEERDFIICVLFLNTLITWHDNPAHQNYLLSVLSDKLGWSDLYRFYLYNAFKLTSPDEHDYLTKAQAYWAALIDEGMFDDAEEFALRLLKNSGEKDFQEIKEIVSLTFHLRKA
ncbi:MAG: hypothetical protein HC887_13235 [Desulfobacteraceae bacterium]|nr:hypothetical protein [Desulfobacteraceae bacterium]